MKRLSKLTEAQAYLLDLVTLAAGGEIQIDCKVDEWRVYYKPHGMGMCIGVGETPGTALADCYRRVCEDRALAAVEAAEAERAEQVSKRTGRAWAKTKAFRK